MISDIDFLKQNFPSMEWNIVVIYYSILFGAILYLWCEPITYEFFKKHDNNEKRYKIKTNICEEAKKQFILFILFFESKSPF